MSYILLHCRSSSHILVDYLNARLAGGEGRRQEHELESSLNVGNGPPLSSEVQLETKRPSGLETLHQMEQALP